MKKFYITTTLPYVNADPHIGFALEIIQADALARFHRILEEEVVFNTGTDEHGQKIYEKAISEGKTPQAYCDEYAAKFEDLKKALNLSYTNFIRTTDKKHIAAAQEFWRKCFANGDIYKKNYKIKYCVGCELEKTDSELVNDYCPLHPKQKLEIIEEENYFFRFSRYQDKLLEFYEKNENFVIPAFRFEEIKSFVRAGLNDFSVSRLKKKMPWGIDVPGDAEHVMYVWFDALINYISTIDWPQDEKRFNEYWPGMQVAGKDNLRQQTAMWQAMLMSANLPNSQQIFIHGFITADGQKMSKSLGNVVNPYDLVKKYGVDAVRYYLLKEIPSCEDGDFSERRMEEIYNADLANELGNLVLRITTLAGKDDLTLNKKLIYPTNSKTKDLFADFRFNTILENIWQKIKLLNKKTDQFEPWKKQKEERKEFLETMLTELKKIACELNPFMPDTADKITTSCSDKIKKIPPLFPRI